MRVALNLKGIVAHERIVNLDAGEPLSAEFLNNNPMGAVPALVDNTPGQPHAPLTQSLAILEFLDELQPFPPLLPVGLHNRARVRSLAAMLAADTHPLLTARIRTYLMTEGRFTDADWFARRLHWFTTGLEAVEQRLVSEPETGKFCHGDSPTMADICLASIVAVMRSLKIEVAGITTIGRIMSACEELSAFADASPSRQVGAPAA